MSTDDGGLVTVSQFATRLGVSPARVRQLVEERKIPQPMRPGAKSSVWAEAVVSAVLEAQAGGVSMHVALAPTADRPLHRMFDGVVEFEPYPERTPNEAHVRIWTPSHSDGVTVVVLGAMYKTGGVTNRIEVIAEMVRDQLLAPDTPLERIAWFEYYPGRSFIGHDEVNNVVFHLDRSGQRHRHLLRTKRTSPTSVSLVEPSWYQCGLAELERVVGSLVECYPEPAYVRPVIEAWQRNREIVEYEHDEYGVHSMMTNVRVLDTAQAPASARNLADDLCHALVTETEVFLGATPSDQPPAATSGGKLFAARLVPTRLTIAEQELFDRYRRHHLPGYLPNTVEDVLRVEPLLQKAQQWSDEVGPDGGSEQPELYAAIKAATEVVARRLQQVDPGSKLRTLPAFDPQAFSVVGPRDAAYLQQVRWSDQAGSSLRRTRLSRKLRTDENYPLKFGLDPDGHLVAYLEEPVYGGKPRFAVEWPTLKPPVPRIGDDIELVADGYQGGRPVYLLDSAGVLRLMPATFSIVMGGWNFGYGGSGPGSLVYAIRELVAASDDLRKDQIPEEWIDDQVSHSSLDSLTISLADLRRRIR